MLLKQVIDNASPLVSWTGERFGGDNVYDDYETTALVSYNATLGAPGSTNPSISSRSMNVNGGYLRALNANLGNQMLVDRDFSVQFGFRIPNRDKSTPITGFRTLVSKWNPEQSWAIVMENGVLGARVQTSTGIVSIDFDYPDITYNNRWNFVQLAIRSTTIELHVNGCPVVVSNSNPIIASSDSLITIGGVGAEQFGHDMLIADVSITRSYNAAFSRALYVLPRSMREIILNLNPTHYFDLTEVPAPTHAHINWGSAGGAGHIVATGADPELTDINGDLSERTANFNVGAKFAIDTMPPAMDFTAGFSIISRMNTTSGGRQGSGIHYDAQIINLRNEPSSDAGRLSIAYMRYGSDPQLVWQAYDAAGAITSIQGSSSGRREANGHTTYGTKVFRFSGGTLRLEHMPWDDWNRTVTSVGLTWNVSAAAPINYFELFGANAEEFNTGHIALFNYAVPTDVSETIGAPKFKLIAEMMYSKHPYHWIAHGQGLNPRFNSPHGNTLYHPYRHTDGWVAATGIRDINNNRQNQYIAADYYPTTTNQTAGYINGGLISSTFTWYAFLWNRNTSTRWRMVYRTNNRDFEIWMNSRDGQFSHGDVEVMMNYTLTSTHISTSSKKFIDDGFHFLTIVRNGLVLQIWVDGELDSQLIMSSAPPINGETNYMSLFGGPLYVCEQGFATAAFDETDIAMIYYGYADFIKGQCTLDQQPLESTLLVTDTHTGKVMATHVTDDQGRFNVTLPKSLDGESVTVLALANDENRTNNVVAHGPYNLQTIYSKYSHDIGGQSYDSMVLDMEPYAYYKLDEASGTLIKDSSGNGRDGTAVGGIVVDAAPGPRSDMKAVTFGGSNGHIDLPDGYNDLTAGFTVEAWVNFEAFQNYARILDIGNPSRTNTVAVATVGTTDDLILIAQATTSTDNGRVISSSGGTIGAWAHIVGRIAPDGEYSLWVNGAKIAVTTGGTVPATVERTLNYIGRSSSSSDAYFNGKMSNVATYLHPLSDEDIARHAAYGFQQPVPTMRSAIEQDNPVVYFTFDRTDQLDNQTDEAVSLTASGTIGYSKNALALNAGVVGNNYLTSNHRIVADVEGWTLEFSFKTGVTHTDAILLGEWDAVTDTGTYKVRLGAENVIAVHLNDAATQMLSTTTYNDNKWHHVMVTHDGVGTISLVVDGSVESTLSTSMTHQLHDLTIGNGTGGALATATDGPTYLDDLAIYPYALSNVRIAEHYARFTKKKVYQ